MDNPQSTIISQPLNGITHWPFDSFYADLKKNGFSLTPTQIINANQVIIQYANWVKNENELRLFLTPVFASNEDEQILFKQIFDAHFKKIFSKPSSTQRPFVKQVKKHWKQFILLYAFIALLIVALIFRSFNHNTRIDLSKVEVYLQDKNNPEESRYPQPVLHAAQKEKLEMTLICSYPDKKKKLSTSVRYDWGDDSRVSNTPSHVYIKSGTYTINAYVNIFYLDKGIGHVILTRKVNVCTAGIFLEIEFNGNKDSIQSGQVLKLKALFNKKIPPDQIQWLSDGVENGTGADWQTIFFTYGKHYVTCHASYSGSPCDIETQANFLVVAPPVIYSKDSSINDSSTEVQIAPPVIAVENTKVDPSRYRFYGILAIVFFLFFLLFIVLREREMFKLGNVKKAALDKYKKLSAPSPGKDEPGVVPFRSKNYLSVHETEISQVAKQMRKRVNDNNSFLHIDKTIRNSIEKMGMFQPVMVNRTRQTEYLLLIDENESNSLQVKFFEYLVALLKKQNVLIDVYYYNNEPKLCYNIHERAGISLERLYVKHERHILLVFGDAHRIINKTHSDIYPAYRESLGRWQYKAIITPIPYPDWSVEEKDILSPEISVFPADKEGLDLLTEILANNETDADIISRLRQKKESFYHAKGLDLNSIDALLKYCDKAHWARVTEGRTRVNILFQWIAALAVYPNIRWEIILAIGRAILLKYDRANELSYTNLLRIVRIAWITKGNLNKELRLELMKALTPENERIARETILFLLKEVPDNEVEKNKGAFREKEIQEVVNEFTLYANDPVFYSDYRRSKNVFKRLWEEGAELDGPVTDYLMNREGSWSTLIKGETTDNGETKNIGIGEYFEATESEETLLSKFYLWIAVISIVVSLSSVIALRILYVWDNYL